VPGSDAKDLMSRVELIGVVAVESQPSLVDYDKQSSAGNGFES